MNSILPERATITRRQMDWLKQIADMADSLTLGTQPVREVKGGKPGGGAGPGVLVSAANVRDELRALLIDVSKANPWQ